MPNSSHSVLEVTNIGKAYRNYGSELWRILSWFGLRFKPVHETWTLQNISFSIAAGEAIGVVGQNGAGKSTLLKIITGTLKPSTGSVTVRGKIAAILELGMGFHPDLTGRQNAYHSAGLMGYTSEQIEAVIDQIEAFTEIGEYFDQPVRTYSSGMQARVAFAVATAFRPDILIVDEALSVGDVYFQSKCFDRMEWMRENGTTVLLVSHDIQAIRSFCDRAILLHHGQLCGEGTPKEVVQQYEHIIHQFSNNLNEEKSIESPTEKIASQDKAELIYFKIFDKQDNERMAVTCDDEIIIEFAYKSLHDYKDPHYGIKISDRFGNSAFETNTFCMGVTNKKISKNEIVIVKFNFKINLGGGDYMFDVAMVNEGYNKMHFREYLTMNRNVGQIKVLENPDSIIFAGYYNMRPTVEVKGK
ncbi:ABC transporter ATP-binding protein [Sulfurimonas sp.]|uniref:ABC transporter ATP-binding protein n=1 Tax=Sulfurimonas sp. TaxID=2022749 RepID=UPI0025F9855A|nr:ABC transporter ATP-binding protein [Sulfurimonas sp.]